MKLKEPLELTKYTADGPIGRLTFCRPKKKNAINSQMRKEVQAALYDLASDPSILICIIDAEGDVFCSGKDLLETVDSPSDSNSAPSSDDLLLYMWNIYKPLIVAADGPCLGLGASFVLGSDIVLMTERATIGWPQVRHGISAVLGPSLLPQALPWQVAMGFLLRAKPLSAQEAYRYGICNEIIGSVDLLRGAYRWAAEILENAPLAVQALKEAGRRGQNIGLESRIGLAREIANRVLSTDDSREGISAFREKRDPKWSAAE